MSSSASAIFTGNSQFATDFQQVISRAVQFASLPMQQVQDQVTTLQSQAGEINTLSGYFSDLQSSIANLDNALGLSSYSAISSATSVATASLSDIPFAGTYTVEVDSIGSNATAMSSDSLPTVTDPTVSGISDATEFQLTVGDATYSINTSDTSLNGLANAINSSSAGVQATVVNIGTQGAKDFRLSILDNKMEDVSIQLASLNGTSPSGALLDPLASGSPTTYRVNGKPPADSDPLTTTTSAVTLAPGVSVALRGTGTTTITVAQNTNSVQSALQSFVNAYNTAQTEVNTNRGQGKGALKGDSILSTLSEMMGQITGYATGTDGISSLTSLGVQFNQDGSLSFNSAVFASATQGQMTQLANFLGSTSSGGFLKTANDVLNGLNDPTTGVFANTSTTLQTEIAHDNQTVSDDQDRINTLTDNLNKQMSAADAAVATMEQQYGYLYQMFQQMQADAQSGMF